MEYIFRIFRIMHISPYHSLHAGSEAKIKEVESLLISFQTFLYETSVVYFQRYFHYR